MTPPGLNAGQTAIVRPGTYDGGTGRAFDCNRSGTSGAYITIRSETLYGAVVTGYADGVVNFGPNCDYVWFEGFRVAGPSINVGGTNVAGRAGSDHIVFTRNEVTAGYCQGIYTEDDQSGPPVLATEDYTISRNWIHDNGRVAPQVLCDRQAHGIYLQGDRHLVENNKIHDHPQGFGIQNYDNSIDARILYNTITHSWQSGIVIDRDTEDTNSGTWAIGNIVAYNGQWGIRTFGDSFPTNCIVSYNLAYQNSQGDFYPTWGRSCTIGPNNTSGAPVFADVAARDFHLKAGSLAIDTGHPTVFPSVDFDGIARPQGSAPDKGAFERVQ